MAESAELEDSTTQVLSRDERRRVLSATRLKFTLTVFVVALGIAIIALNGGRVSAACVVVSSARRF